MYQASAAYKNFIEQDSRTFMKSKLFLGDTEINANITSIILKGGSNSGTSFIVGSCISQYIEVQMEKPSVFVENEEIEWRIGGQVSETVEEYIPMGIFTAQKPEVDEEIIKFIAYDRMMKTERAYFSSLPATTTTIAVLNEMSTFLGVPIVTTGLSAITIKRPDGYTCREVLSYISQMYAGFAVCDRLGQITIKTYTASGLSVAPAKYWDSFTHNEFPYTFQKITCHTGKDAEGNTISISAGSGNREMTISNPLMTQSILNSVAAKLQGFNYMAGSLKFLGDPRVDVWDIISVASKEGTVYKVPVMNFTQDFDGGLTSTVEAVAETETQEQQGFKGPLTQAIERVSIKLALIDHAVINKLDVDTANITFARIVDLQATNAEITKLRTEDLVAINAKINTANINLGNIENLLAGNAGVGDLTNIHLTSQNAVIESALIKNIVSQAVTVNDLLAGTIYTNKFQIWSDAAGGMKIFGATQQWMDKDSVIRMQAGLDANGEFNYYIVDKFGNTMFDALNGISASGIKAPIIKDSMVADDANINGNKVDVQTLVQNINGSNVQLSGSKVIIDGTGQTVSAKLSTMQEEINGISDSSGGYILQTYVEGGHTGKYTHTAYAWSADGTDRFTTVYPKENLVRNTSSEWANYSFNSWQPPNDGVIYYLSDLGLKEGDTLYVSAEYEAISGSGVLVYLPFIDKNGTTISWLIGNKVSVGQTGISEIIGTIPVGTTYFVFFHVAQANSISLSTGRYRKNGVYKSNIPVRYTPSPLVDPENAYPTYMGIYTSDSPEQSTEPGDYVWSKVGTVPSLPDNDTTGNTSTIRARLYNQNKDVTTTFGPEHYLWKRLSEDVEGDAGWNARQITGYSLTLFGSDVTMVASFECQFIDWDEEPILDFNGNPILDFGGNQIIGLTA